MIFKWFIIGDHAIFSKQCNGFFISVLIYNVYAKICLSMFIYTDICILGMLDFLS